MFLKKDVRIPYGYARIISRVRKISNRNLPFNDVPTASIKSPFIFHQARLISSARTIVDIETFNGIADEPLHSSVQNEIKIHEKTQNSPLVQSDNVEALSIESINSSVADVEIKVFNFIEKGDLSSAAEFLALALDSGIVISNQLWSFFVLESCIACHYEACSLAYEFLVAPPRESYYFPLNKIPYLLTPESLVGLAVVFAQHYDPVKLMGLNSYFKRFYSYISHKQTFVDLRTLLVEAKSGPGSSYNDSLKAFSQLDSMFRSSTVRSFQTLKEKVFSNFRWRRDGSIKKNINTDYSDFFGSPLDKSQESEAKQEGLEIFRPFLLHNIYSTPEHKQFPLIHGSLRTTDVPNFYQRTHEKIESLMNSEEATDKVSTLVSFVNLGPSSLHVFVFKLLCQQQQFKAATLFLFSYIHNKKKDNSGEFILLKEILTSYLHYCQPIADQNRHQTELFSQCYELMKRCYHSPNSNIVALYISIMLLLPKTKQNQIEPFLEELNEAVIVDTATYKRFKTMFGNLSYKVIYFLNDLTTGAGTGVDVGHIS